MKLSPFWSNVFAVAYRETRILRRDRTLIGMLVLPRIFTRDSDRVKGNGYAALMELELTGSVTFEDGVYRAAV